MIIPPEDLPDFLPLSLFRKITFFSNRGMSNS